MPLANPKTNPDLKIFLVGFMGTGKTTLGRLLAERIGWVFFDLDALMEEVEGATIMRIFIEKGEPYFRTLESSTIARLAAHPGHAVIACGGGTFCTPQNQAVMLQRGVTVWIDQPFDQVWQRRDELALRRPLLRGEPAFRALYEQRVPFYHLASLRLRVDEGALPQAVNELVRLLEERFAVV